MRNTLLIILTFLFTSNSFAQSKKITIEDLWQKNVFYPKTYSSPKSMNDGEHYVRLNSSENAQKIIKYKYKNGKKTRTLFNTIDFDIPKITNYKFSDDEKKILLFTETEKIYRYSKKSIVYVYNSSSDKIQKINDKKIMHATFSPNGTKVAYVLENNLFVYNLKNKSTKQITTDGKKNNIINGSSDWVYEEEFKLVKAFEWSPDGRNIAYYKFDETHVKLFTMNLFKDNLYPIQEQFKYPKAGEKNSVVKIYNYNFESDLSEFIFTEQDYEYFPRIKWSNNPELLCIYGMNRHQNKLDFIIADVLKKTTKVLFYEKDKYYIEINDNLTFLADNNFIWTSEKDGFNHIYIKNLDGSEEQITKGNWEVTSFNGFDSNLMQLFYTSTEDGSINRSTFIYDLRTKEKTKLNHNKGYNDIIFSKNFNYYINSYSNGNTAPVFSLHDRSGKQILIFEDNHKFNKEIEEYNLSKKEFITIKTSDTELNAWVIKPPNFNPEKQYPLYMFVYGGPGSQLVTNSFGWTNYFWHQMLAQKGYIVACVDNRGTGGKGAEFKKMTYKELGKYETIDQINAAKYFSSLDYIDKNRIGIQGWSYGGYLSSLCITKGADIFKLAIAIAPVTNWRFYDNIYTERYMRTPSENKKGYEENSPINHVSKLKGHYLLIHGTADDNVHVQNSYEMISALIKENKQFEHFIYPDKNHGIYGGTTRFHLYTKMTDYIISNL